MKPKDTVKIIVSSICFIVVVFLLLGRFDGVVKALGGRGVVMRRSGCMKSIVSGAEVECPYWVIDKTTVPNNIANLHAFQIGTNSTVVVVHVGEHDLLYWFDGGKVGVTRCNWDTWSLLNRWLFLSEVALNATYDVRHDMKGLNASVVCRETGSGVEYTLKYLNRKSPREIVVEINEFQRGGRDAYYRRGGGL